MQGAWRSFVRYQKRLNDMGLLFLVGGFFAIFFACVLAVDRAYFVGQSAVVTGKVVRVEAKNDRCGRRRSRYDCTEFNALIDFSLASSSFEIGRDAGSGRGHNQPVERADYHVGQTIGVRYKLDEPEVAYLDDWWDIFKTPIFILLFGGLMLLRTDSERDND
jgi:hypothetical protein